MTKLKTNQAYQVAPKLNLRTLTTKAQLNTIIVDRYGRPDYLAINLYWDSLRSWYNPKVPYKKGDNIYYLSKLRTKGIFLYYKKLAEAHGCSTETVRQKMVKLEQLGLIQRSFQHKETVTTKSYNKLIVYVWKDTPHFYNNFGTDYEKVELNPYANHEYIEKKYKKKFAENLPQEHAISGGGGIQVSVDTKELNNYSNKLEYRSISRTREELNPNLNISNSNNPTCNNNGVQSDTTESVDTKKVGGKKESLASIPSPRINQKLSEGKILIKPNKIRNQKTVVFPWRKYQKPKTLSDMLLVLTDRICQEIIAKSGRLDFNNNYIKQLIMKLDKVSKHVHFFSLKGFIAYMAARVKEELRDPTKCSSPNYRMEFNLDQELREDCEKNNITDFVTYKDRENYLNNIEDSAIYCRSDNTQYRAKVVGAFPPNLAYSFLTKLKSFRKVGEVFEILMAKKIEISEHYRNVLLNQANAVGGYTGVNKLEFINED